MHVSQLLIKRKGLLYQVPTQISWNSAIVFVKCFTTLEERLVSSRFTFAQNYKLHGDGQYKLNGSIINVLVNIDETQSFYLKCFITIQL
jgi:hypothetical protein